MTYNPNLKYDPDIFIKILNGEIKTELIFEDDEIFAFDWINPAAPIHILFVPKKNIPTINDLVESDNELVGKIILKASEIAKNLGIEDEGYRLIFNVNAGGGQHVFQIHLHLLAGRSFNWPPG